MMSAAKTALAASVADLRRIHGVGKSIANDLVNIGIWRVHDLIGRDPYELFDQSNEFAGVVLDRSILYVLKCAVYFAETPSEVQDP